MRTRMVGGFLVAGLLVGLSTQVKATTSCSPTGFFRDGINMTAALINPVGTVTGTLNAAGCNIGVYYGAGVSGVVKGADISGANYFGVLVNGDAGTVNVDVTNNTIHNIGETPLNGSQHGVAIYYRGFFEISAVTGKISGNVISAYQKGAIVVNGPGVQATVMDNTITGSGHVDWIAQNGIQVGYGATASVMRNRVSDNSYDGHADGSSSGGIIIVGGGGYGDCPDGNPCQYTVNAKVNDNVLTNNDVGVYLSNLADDYSAPTDATNIKVVNNTISNDSCFNPVYQAAVSDVGNNDKIITNKISGAGYLVCTSLYNPSPVGIDAATSFTNRPKVHANK